MVTKKTSFDLIDQVLARDIYSHTGVLLLAEGTRLQHKDIVLLIQRGIQEVEVYHQLLSPVISGQMDQLWYKSDKETQIQYLEALEKTKTYFQQASEEGPAPLTDLLPYYYPLLEKMLKFSYLLHPLHKIKGHDEYTYRHSLNVGLLAAIIGKILGLSNEESLLLGQMGLFHDIGKMRVPSEILHKPGKLTESEYIEMQNHTIYGYQMLKEVEGIDDIICEGALLHHERMDGTGYPQRLKGEQIPFLIQILSVADTYDAICSDRIYKTKSSSYFAVQELMNEIYQGRLNPRIVIPFVNYLVSGYVGDQAILENGETGEVVRIFPEEPHRPLIRIGEEYVDLRMRRDLKILEILPV